MSLAFKLFTPFRNNVVTSRFNAPRNYSFALNRLQLHEGEDSVDGDGIGIVYSGHAGRCTKIGYDARGYGNYCIIDFGNGWACWYAHFERIDVTEGQFVKTRQALGLMGGTGNASGAHCHLTLQHIGHGLKNYVVTDVVDPAPHLVKW